MLKNYSMLLKLVFFFLFLYTVWVYWQFKLSFILKRESNSPFECGFDPKDKARLPFSLRFFSLLILFIIFDLELIFMFQIPLLDSSLANFGFHYMMFFFFLFGGLLEEWRRSFLDWKF